MTRFPVLVDHAIYNLFGERPEIVRARTLEQQVAKRAVNLDRIRLIEAYLISATSAQIGLQLVWQEQLPFCLFLRSYAMGHRAGQQEDPSAQWDPMAPHFLDTTEPIGGRLLRLVNAALNERAMLLALANPAEWLTHSMVKGPFANLVVDPSFWQDIVHDLIPAAKVIVIHRESSTEGVDYELEQIREAGCEDRTIIVREPEVSPCPQDADIFFLKEKSKRDQARIVAKSGENVFPPDPALDGMPHVLEWREDAELESSIRKHIEFLLNIPVDRKFDSLPDISPNLGDAKEADKFEQDARKAYECANQFLQSGDIDTAEELLFECYALCCLANEVGGRASASLELGRLLILSRRDAQAALIPLEYASSHFMTMASGDDPIAGTIPYALEASHLFAAAQLLCGEEAMAEAIIESAETWQNTPPDRRKQKAIWDFVKDNWSSKGVERYVKKHQDKWEKSDPIDD